MAAKYDCTQEDVAYGPNRRRGSVPRVARRSVYTMYIRSISPMGQTSIKTVYIFNQYIIMSEGSLLKFQGISQKFSVLHLIVVNQTQCFHHLCVQ